MLAKCACSHLGGGGALGLVVPRGRREGGGGELPCMSLSLAHSLWLDEHSDPWASPHGMLSLCPPSPPAPRYLREGQLMGMPTLTLPMP